MEKKEFLALVDKTAKWLIEDGNETPYLDAIEDISFRRGLDPKQISEWVRRQPHLMKSLSEEAEKLKLLKMHLGIIIGGLKTEKDSDYLKKFLKRISGITSVEIDLLSSLVSVDFEKSSIGGIAIEEAIEKAGFIVI